MSIFSKRNIYLDHASTTPLDKKVLSVMSPYFTKKFFNPSSIYNEGREISAIVEKCRAKVARYIACKPDNIIFTGSGTESDNMSILGIYEAYKKDMVPHFISSTIEHPAVMEALNEVEKRGGEVTYITPEEDGIISPDKIAREIKPTTILISIIHTNNEIGTIQKIKDISREVNKWKKVNNRGVHEFPFIHTDASQSPNYIKCNRESIGADLITLDGSKIYGPKGVGILYKHNKVEMSPIMFGGGQENGYRPGTENVAGIVGFTKALEMTEEIREKEVDKLHKLQEYFIDKLIKAFPNATINGSLDRRLPNNINICIPGIDSEFVTIALSQRGIQCSFMTACRNLGYDSASYVIGQINPDCAKSSIRFSMGRNTKKSELIKTVRGLEEIIKK